MGKLFAAIEAGGTKFVCGVGSDPGNVEEVRFPTGRPENTLSQALDFFRAYAGQLDGIGIGTFGPIDLDKSSPRYGHITSTPKAGWADTDIVGPFVRQFDVPIGFDTDVNAAAFGEWRWGAGRGLTDLVYITIGTGVGGGVISGGARVHGLIHPELGHILIAKRPEDRFSGHCPFHGDQCFEGLCSGPALEARWGIPSDKLPADHQAWEFQAFYVAQAMTSIICMISPQRIILGGGVMQQRHLLSAIRQKTQTFLNNYVQHPAVLTDINNYIVSPGLGNMSGLAGALALAAEASEY